MFRKILFLLIVFVLSSVGTCYAQSFFKDDNTVVLWLFDESNYPHTTLTDSSINEYDLCLMDAGKLVKGQFGNALSVGQSKGFGLCYAGFKGSISIKGMRVRDGNPSGLFGPTQTPVKLLNTLASNDFTIEMWIRTESQNKDGFTVLDIGQAYDLGISIELLPGLSGLRLVNSWAGFQTHAELVAKINDGKWHHLAICKNNKKVSFYIDGKVLKNTITSYIAKASTPELVTPTNREDQNMGFTKDTDENWRRQNRFNVAIGQNRKSNNTMYGLIDEVRISDICRYKSDFLTPGSFSRNYGLKPTKACVADGPKLLFADNVINVPVQLGSRKHLFIDESLVGSKSNIKLTCNSPYDRRKLNFGPDKSAWRASVMDVDGKVYMYIPDGYGSAEGLTRLRISHNGVDFKIPKLGAVEYQGSKDNEYVLAGVPLYGSFFKDTRKHIDQAEKYKMTAWVANRGIYMYMSPDGIHWQRNECCMLPLVSGGGAETFWDDQRGVYVDFIKRDASFKTKAFGGGGRRACIFETTNPYITWPFKPLEKPYYEGWPMPAVTGEGPVIFGPNNNGQVYRTRAIKYPWAPDVYLAFVWRYFSGDQHRQVDLGVSRDGINWKLFADEKWYLEPEEYEEVLSLYGLIRRNDEIWQYFDYGGAHGGDKKRVYARLTQRLDGFVSLDAGAKVGTILTKPLVFEGSKLVLNIKCDQTAKIAITDENGAEIPGFGISNCQPIKGDHIRKTVSWDIGSDVNKLAGKTVRVKFQMLQGKLFAMQFEP